MFFTADRACTNTWTLATFAVLLLLASAGTLHAQDTRTVTEPVFPATCTTLIAQLSISSGEPSSETAFDTSRIQSALSSCASGKAVELIASSTSNAFLVAPITIPNGVTLLVDAGVTIFASRNPVDYQAPGNVETCGTVGTSGNGCTPLFNVNNNSTSSGSGVMGYGVINGRGGDKLLIAGAPGPNSWWDLASQANTGNNAQNNPILMYIKKASNFTLYKITLENSPMFHVKWQQATGLTVWGVKIVTPYNARNTDGIDPGDNVSNITIANSYLSDGDDDVAIGASGSSSASNISISNVHTYSGHGISIGSYTSGGVSNMLVDHLNQSGNISDSNATGIRIKSASDRGGLVNNITYQNVCMQNERTSVQFTPVYNNNSGSSIPSFTNITLRDITVLSNTSNQAGQFQFLGKDASHLTTITLDNVFVGNYPQFPNPSAQYVTFALGPGPVTPASLQQLTGPGVTYTGTVTNPTEPRYPCATADFPILAGELFLSTSSVTNLQSLALPNPASFSLNAVVEPTEAASVTPTSPITFLEGTKPVGTATLSGNGTLATLALSGIASGTHSYTAQYPSDGDYPLLNFGSVTVTVSSTATTTTLAAAPTSAVYGNSVTLTATVTASSGTPTGTVTFRNGTTILGTGTLNASGVATLSTAILPVGNDPVAAYFAASTNFAASDSSSAPVNVAVTQAGSSTAVTAAPLNAVYATQITLTANVTSSTTGTPTGIVTFMDGSTSLGTATLAAGTAVLNTTTLPAGAHSILALYGGDANFTASTSPLAVQVSIITASSTTHLGFTSPTVAFGAQATMIAVVNSGTSSATGAVTFTEGSATLGTTTLVSGSATLNTSTLAIGAHTITATYAGDNNYTGSASNSAVLTVTPASSSTALAAASTTPVYGASDTLTATVTVPGNTAPTGMVSFSDGTTVLAASVSFGAINPGSGSYTAAASFASSSLTGGAHSLTATYTGDANFTASTSAPLVLTIATAATTTVLNAPGSLSYGNPATLTAGIASAANGLTGTVTFYDGATAIGNSSVALGASTYVANNLPAGTHTLTAVYSGDTNFATSTSAPVTLTISKATTTSNIAATPTTLSYGATTTFNASVLPVTATGSFTFKEGTTTLGTVTLAGGTATLASSTLSVGTHSVTAIYSGDANNAPSTTSTPVVITINQVASTVSLTVIPSTVILAASTTLTATINPTSATGTVSFRDGAVTLATVTLANGSASFVATLPLGSHTLSAVYSGDTNDDAATSAPVTVTVVLAPTTTTISASPATLTFGATATLTAAVAPTSATGILSFSDTTAGGTTTLGTAPLSAGVATFTTTTLQPGTHTLTAIYSGDSAFSASTSATPATITVNQSNSTTTLVATPPQTVPGQIFNLTATAAATVQPSNAPTGSITFFGPGNTNLGAVPLVNGTATLSLTLNSLGSYTYTASYSGDTDFSSSTAAAITVQVKQFASVTALTASPVSATFGITSFSFAAQVTPASGGPATGSVTFTDTSTTPVAPLGTVTLSATGAASLANITLGGGTHNIVASYLGDPTYASSSSAPTAVIVNPAATATTFTATPATSAFGTSITLSAAVASTTRTPATGIVSFHAGSTILGSAPLNSSGIASFTTTTLTIGTYAVTANYAGDINFSASTSASATVTVTQIPQTITLSGAPATAIYGAAPVTVSAGASSNLPVALSIAGPATLTGSVLSISGAGTVTLTASQPGNTSYAPATAVTQTIIVNKASLTVTTANQAINAGAPLPTLTGSLAGLVNGDIITAKFATAATASSPSGTYPITATLADPGSRLANYAVTNPGGTLTISASATSAALTPATTTATFGTSPAILATITGSSSTPSGTVTLKSGTTSVGSGTLAATTTAGTAIATITVSTASLGVGSFTLTASYPGDPGNAASSATATLNLTAAATSTSLNFSATQVAANTPVTLTAAVSSNAGTPTGTVTFLNGTTSLGSTSLNGSGTASLTLSTLTIATYNITATYSAGGNFAASSSAAQMLAVVPPVTVTATPNAITLNPGASGTSALSIVPVGGFTGNVTLTCASPVAYLTCTVTAPSAIAGTTPSTATVTIGLAATFGHLVLPRALPPTPSAVPPTPPSSHAADAILLPLGAIFLLPLFARRRNVIRLLALYLCIGAICAGLTGCGGNATSSSPHLPPPGTQTITLTTTANATIITTPITVTVN